MSNKGSKIVKEYLSPIIIFDKNPYRKNIISEHHKGSNIINQEGRRNLAKFPNVTKLEKLRLSLCSTSF